ncbi:hypothetical protein AV540_06130 [Brevibacillus parabrevis]|uniref:DUF3899 domain-containing protein n=1 Tax=Brevibacillus parabrevis TaxID=54914 RepID=UPI0007AC05D4|nr:DUF3899 domain-containing protein [Brevibacillus parabrevis]KZE54607.1 hypothetical protein AV540_06130 [Brevibacillus parabrevis]
MNNWFAIILVLAITCSLVLGVTSETLALLPYINQSFLLGLILLMVGCAAVVTRSGFFIVFMRGFKQLKGFFFRKPRMMESDLVQGDDPVFAQKKQSVIKVATSLFLASGTGLIVFSLVLTCFYYL